MQYTRFCNILDTKQGTLMCDGILKTVRISYGFFEQKKKKIKHVDSHSTINNHT